MAKKIPIDTQELAVNILRQVDGMRRYKKHCDFLIKVGSEEIPVHRNILSATSDYFGAMFSHPTQENKSGVVEMMDVDPECAIICVDHMYGNEVSILPQQYEPLMYVAILMQLQTLRDAISTLLEANLDPKSFWVARKLANLFGLERLKQVCINFAEENFGLISEEQQFYELEKTFVKEMLENVKTVEEEKLDALLRWIKYNPERKAFLKEMLKVIDLLNVPAENRRYLLEKESLFSESLDLFRLVCFSFMDTHQIVSAKPGQRFNMIALFDRISGHLQCWNPRNNKWKQMQRMNDDMMKLVEDQSFSAVALKDYIYVLMENKSVYRLQYPYEGKRWERMADMLDKHGFCPPAASFSGDIYVIGGHQVSSASMEKYDAALNTWTRLEDKPKSSKNAELLSFGGYIYNFGGFFGERFTSEVCRFDPVTRTWDKVSPMNEAKGSVAVVELNSKVYVLGGSLPASGYTPRFRTTECYDPATDTWSTMKQMNTLRSRFRAFAVGGSIYALGGYSSSPDSIEKYDVERNEWEMVEIPDGINLEIMESVEIKLPQ